MSLIPTILEKANALTDAEFQYTNSSNFSLIDSLDNDCTGLVMESTVIYFEIKNLHLMLKTGKRLAARVYKIYYNALKEVCTETEGFLNCCSPNSFLLIYPKEQHHVNQVVEIAMKIADLFSIKMREVIEKNTAISFAMGVDIGNILCTKVNSDYGYSQAVWFGTAINKAATICHECNRPFFVGVSGTVFNRLDENLKVTTKRILGIKKQIDMWTRNSYMFENEKKHLYQTNFHKSFEAEEPQE